MLNLSVSGKSGWACSSRAARTISRRASGDALHLAIAKRQSLTIASSDQGLVKAAEVLHLPFQLIT